MLNQFKLLSTRWAFLRKSLDLVCAIEGHGPRRSHGRVLAGHPLARERLLKRRCGANPGARLLTSSARRPAELALREIAVPPQRVLMIGPPKQREAGDHG
jgi:hypothetical protein